MSIGEHSVDVGNVNLTDVADTFPQEKFFCKNKKQTLCTGTGGSGAPVDKMYSIMGNRGGSNCWYDGHPTWFPRISKGELTASYEATWGSEQDIKDQFLATLKTTIENIGQRSKYKISTDCFICRVRGWCSGGKCSTKWWENECACPDANKYGLAPTEALQCKTEGVGYILPAYIKIEIYSAETPPIKNGIQQLPQISGIALGASLNFKLARTDFPKGGNFCSDIQLSKWGGMVAPVAGATAGAAAGSFGGPVGAGAIIGATAVTMVQFVCG